MKHEYTERVVGEKERGREKEGEGEARRRSIRRFEGSFTSRNRKRRSEERRVGKECKISVRADIFIKKSEKTLEAQLNHTGNSAHKYSYLDNYIP